MCVRVCSRARAYRGVRGVGWVSSWYRSIRGVRGRLGWAAKACDVQLLTGDQASADCFFAYREPVDHLFEEIDDGSPFLARDGAGAVDHQPKVGVCVRHTLPVCMAHQRPQQRDVENQRKGGQAGKGRSRWCACTGRDLSRPGMRGGALIGAAGAAARGRGRKRRATVSHCCAAAIARDQTSTS